MIACLVLTDRRTATLLDRISSFSDLPMLFLAMKLTAIHISRSAAVGADARVHLEASNMCTCRSFNMPINNFKVGSLRACVLGHAA